MDLIKLFETWYKRFMAVILLALVLIGVGIGASAAGWNFINPVGLLLILGFAGLAFGLERHVLGWQPWGVFASGVCLSLLIGSITAIESTKFWVWPVAAFLLSGLLAIDEEQTTIRKVFPDYKTGVVFMGSFVALISLLTQSPR